MRIYTFDFSSIGGILASLWELATGALRFDSQAYYSALNQPGGGELVFALVLISGISITFGQSVVLFANRVSRTRFIISLFFLALALVVSIFIWAGSIWLIATFILGASRPYNEILIGVGLSYLPFLFGFLVLMPYFGNIIYPLLRIWIFLGTLLAVSVAFEFNFWQSLACSILGWLLLELVTRFRFLQIDRLRNIFWRLGTGIPQPVETQALVDEFVDTVRKTAPPPQANGERP